MKQIPGHDGYFATEEGQIWSEKTQRYLKSRLNRCGYPYVVLSGGQRSKRKTATVHRLIAKTFLDPQDGEVVNHKDCNKRNNHLSNLELVTPKENIRHAWRAGRCKANNPRHKLNESLVHNICLLLLEGHLSHTNIGKHFNVSQATITHIANKQAWVSVSDEVFPHPLSERLRRNL